jgi:phytoene dehydrogenase-like protein
VQYTASLRRWIRTRRTSALDLEEKPGPAGEDIFHGALGLGQLWAAQPMLRRGDDRTPVKNM